jgi:hypothetical protein
MDEPVSASRSEVYHQVTSLVRRPRVRSKWLPAAMAIVIAMTPAADGQTGRAPAIRIVVVEGDHAINNIQLQRAHAPVIKVVDRDDAPVSNATVTFTVPLTGPGGSFLDGRQTLTVRTDSDGVATARGLRPNNTPGQFQIRVAASVDGETANALITQTNVKPAVQKSKSKLYVILGIVAAGAAGGLIAATRGSSGSSSNAPAPAGGVTPGAPSFGPPR